VRTALTIITLIALGIAAGCGTTQKTPTQNEQTPAPEEIEPTENENDKVLLTVDFQQGKTLEYKFVSRREITIEWDPERKMSRPGAKSAETITESLDVVVAYEAVEVDPFALTTIKATCKSVRVSRSKNPAGSGRKDAVEYLTGKSYTFKIGPTGKIEDNSELDKLLKEIGEKAFRPGTERGRIKEADMISDFIATQWFLWDSISSIPKPSEGLDPNQTWNSQLSVPTPMVTRKARNVTYKLDAVQETPKGKVAVITSTYTAAESVPKGWPVPYWGRFRMAGTFGFLSGYKLLTLEGKGRETFNIDEGRTEQANQQYDLKIQAVIPMGLSAKPHITIKQSIAMRLVK